MKLMTEKQLARIWHENTGVYFNFAKAIERIATQRALAAAADCCESQPLFHEEHAECAAAIRAMAKEVGV